MVTLATGRNKEFLAVMFDRAATRRDMANFEYLRRTNPGHPLVRHTQNLQEGDPRTVCVMIDQLNLRDLQKALNALLAPRASC